MTELALRQDTAPAMPLDPTGGRLVAWAEAAHAANQLAKALSRTSFVPAAFKGNEYDATAAILMGDEVGLSPLASLRSIYVVHGTPAMYARTMVALALSHGHKVWTEKSTDTEVVVCGQRKGNEHIERSVWTLARATKAGYASNKKYQTNGAEMLYAKAAAEIARKIAADVLAGIGASVEDLELEEQPTTTVTRTPTAAAKTTVSRRKPAPVEPEEPAFDKPVAPEPEPQNDGPELIRDAQMKMMMALFNERGFKDRDDRLDYVRDIVGIDVGSSKELSVADASKVIDALDRLSTDETDPQ